MAIGTLPARHNAIVPEHNARSPPSVAQRAFCASEALGMHYQRLTPKYLGSTRARRPDQRAASGRSRNTFLDGSSLWNRYRYATISGRLRPSLNAARILLVGGGWLCARTVRISW